MPFDSWAELYWVIGRAILGRQKLSHYPRLPNYSGWSNASQICYKGKNLSAIFRISRPRGLMMTIIINHHLVTLMVRKGLNNAFKSLFLIIWNGFCVCVCNYYFLYPDWRLNATVRLKSLHGGWLKMDGTEDLSKVARAGSRWLWKIKTGRIWGMPNYKYKKKMFRR